MQRPVDSFRYCRPDRSIAVRRSRGRRDGFSLLELLVVVSIIVMLSAMIAPNALEMARKSRVAQAAESVREVLARCRTFALDAGIDYQFRYEPNGQYFVALPMEMEPAATNSTGGEADTSNYVRLAGQLHEDFRLQATDDGEQNVEALEVAWFGQLKNSLLLSQASWSSPVIFRFDGTADDAEFQVTMDDTHTADLSVRGLTGAISVSQVYREAQ